METIRIQLEPIPHIWNKQQYIREVTEIVDNFVLENIKPFPIWFNSIEEVLARAADINDPFYIKAAPVKAFIDQIYVHLEQYFMMVTEDTIVPLKDLLEQYEQIGLSLKEAIETSQNG